MLMHQSQGMAEFMANGVIRPGWIGFPVPYNVRKI